jgi:hypothetical protein
MLGRMPTIIFDTSGLNELLDDRESQPIVKGLGVGFRVRLTETNVTEIGATTNPARREKLLTLCQHLAFSGECIKPYHWIVEEVTRKHAAHPSGFDWQGINLQFPELQEELARREFLGKDEMAAEIQTDCEARSDEFESVYQGARLAFDRIFEEPGAERPPISKLIEGLKKDGGALWRIATGIYKRATGKELSELEIRAFVDACPPFHALLLSLCVAQFQRCIRDVRTENMYKAGRLDLFMATYLPYCDRFVTRDRGQYNSLSVIAAEAAIPSEVQTYAKFRQSWLVSV